MIYQIPIPYVYLGLTAGYERRAELFKNYVLAYIEHSYPELEFIKIEGMKVICREKGVS